MLAQKKRLKKADFEPIFKKGSKKFSNFFNLRFLANQSGYCRFAVIVSNKISKKSTERNKIKRQIREILKENLSNFKQNNDIIITVLAPVKGSDFQDIKDNFVNLAKKSGLL